MPPIKRKFASCNTLINLNDFIKAEDLYHDDSFKYDAHIININEVTSITIKEFPDFTRVGINLKNDHSTILRDCLNIDIAKLFVHNLSEEINSSIKALKLNKK